MPTARFALAGTDAPCPKGVPGLREGACVYAIGGNNGTTVVSTVEAFSPATNTWATLPSMPTARAGLAAATAPCPEAVNGLRGLCVYAIGGASDTNTLTTVEAYSPATNTWATLPPLPTGRSLLAATDAPCPRGVSGLRGRCVYAIGGTTTTTVVSTVEAYSPATNTWATLPSMPAPRAALAAATAPCPEGVGEHRAACVYALGGFNGTSGSLATVEAYSPATNTWATLPSMPTPRPALAAAAAPCPRGSDGGKRAPAVGATSQPGDDGDKKHRDEICVYAIGGTFGHAGLGTVEVYSPAANNWATLPSMPTGRDLLAAVAAPCPDSEHRRCVYAIGGSNGGTPLSTVEAFGIETGHRR